MSLFRRPKPGAFCEDSSFTSLLKHASWLNMAEIELSVYSRSLPVHVLNDERLANHVQALTDGTQ